MAVKCLKIIPVESEGSLRAFANVNVDNLLEINGLRVIEGRDGLFVAMPQRQYEDRETREPRYSNIVWILDKALSDDITAEVLAAFGENDARQHQQRGGSGGGGYGRSGGGNRQTRQQGGYASGGGGGGGGRPQRGQRYTQPAPQRAVSRQRPDTQEFEDDGFPDALPGEGDDPWAE
jgi:stage V sporulation protein G